MNNPRPDALYHSNLGVRSYDLFNERAGLDGIVKGDIDFYVCCAKDFGGPILELATGTGRVLFPIAAAGFDITGMDFSKPMLDLARRKLALESSAVRERIRMYQMDMASFELVEVFRLAIVPFRAFHHLTLPSEQRHALGCINRSLISGGHLVIDLLDPLLNHCVPGAPPPISERRTTDPATGRTVIRKVIERINDPVNQTFTERFRIEEFDEQGRSLDSEDTSWTFKWATRQEMRYLFELTGFEVVAEYSDFHRSSPSYGREQLWIVRKVNKT
jgi:SAM-dependent methyltransferase